MLKKPIAVTGTAAPEELDVEVIVGRKVAVHCLPNSPADGLVYLTQGEAPDAAVPTMTIVPGGLYEIPQEHSGEVWTAGNGALMTVTQYG